MITEGPARKGGRNPASRITERPAAPGAYLPSAEAIEKSRHNLETAMCLAIGLHFCRGEPPYGVDDLRRAFVDALQDAAGDLGLELIKRHPQQETADA